MLIPPVSRYMTPTPRSVSPRDRLSKARELMRTEKIQHLPVIDEQELVGIVSDRDARRLHTSDDNVADAMTCEVTAVPIETPIDEVIELMDTKRIGSVVLLRDGGVAGIFTTTDALRAFRDLLHRVEAGER